MQEFGKFAVSGVFRQAAPYPLHIVVAISYHQLLLLSPSPVQLLPDPSDNGKSRLPFLARFNACLDGLFGEGRQEPYGNRSTVAILTGGEPSPVYKPLGSMQARSGRNGIGSPGQSASGKVSPCAWYMYPINQPEDRAHLLERKQGFVQRAIRRPFPH